MRLLTLLRCRLALRILRTRSAKRYFFANLVCPSTDALVRFARKPRPPIPLPRVTHIFYHQASVEAGCAENSLQTLLWNIPETDEVILYDKGGTLPEGCFSQLNRQHWRSWAVHREVLPDMAAYTYGMNHSMPMAQAPVIMLWRSDYVYPRGLYEKYLLEIATHDIVLPYSVYIGAAHVGAEFVRANWTKLDPYDEAFWSANAAEKYSLYESQDPVLFAIHKRVWLRLGGLNHLLWGYGWQFGEFAARLRSKLPKRSIKYFDGPPPVHQNHASSLMVRTGSLDKKKDEEDRVGRGRFAAFLGAPEIFDCYVYRWRQKLKPLPLKERA